MDDIPSAPGHVAVAVYCGNDAICSMARLAAPHGNAANASGVNTT